MLAGAGQAVAEEQTGGSRSRCWQVQPESSKTPETTLGEGGRGGQRPGAPLVSPYLGSGAKASALGLPLDTQALPCQSHLPALLCLGLAPSSKQQPPLRGTASIPQHDSSLGQRDPDGRRGREKPWPGPGRSRRSTTGQSGGAEKKTRSSDRPQGPRGTGTIEKPGADFTSGSAPGLLLPPPSYSPPNSPVR